ncbi:MAG TPA: glycerate dehydrogenase [Clostridiales bacterium]|nr:glycerate dehydrogenase [Clostridiales bacterium]HBP52192.1 glycerate dehydrogenase [Clostridiales bacterium]HBW06010.1 glycerate dehydrogenase [Clostridiales bacterium]HCH92754.1 glycerate dehydrogenase [Clostridiales bacterium]
MKIVILDGATAKGKELNFDFLNRFGDVTYYDTTSKEDVLPRAKDADILVINKIVMDKDTLAECKNLKLITILATGYNIVDIEAAKTLGITVCNVPYYSTNSVAQLTFAFILEFACKLSLHTQSVARGDWQNCKDFAYTLDTLHELCGKTLGIIGYGSIGKKVAQIGKAFGMNVLISTRTPVEGCVSKEEVFKNADFVTLHCPLNEQSKLMINEKSLALFKPTAYLINTARGGLVDENALADALNSGKIAGAALDVLTSEPPEADNPLIHAENCIITPHIGWASLEARVRLLHATEDNVRAFLQNSPINKVN